MIAIILTLVVFAIVILSIALEKINRALISILGAIILFCFLLVYTQNILNVASFPIKIDLFNVNNLIILILDIPTPQKIFLILFQNSQFEPFNFTKVIEFMIGTKSDGYNNLHSIILILGIMIQVEICQEAGVFQFLALKLVKNSKGNPNRLLLICCLLSVFISAILNNILTVFILIPLTIMICRMLSINPIPYILSEAILVNIGGIMFLISSVPNVLISQAAGLNFIDYLINVAWFALILLVITFAIFQVYFKKKLKVPEERLVRVLDEFNPWNFVPDRGLFLKSIFSLTATFVLIIVIPSFPDITALTIGIILIIISKLKTEEALKKINFELILYLLGIFIITGCLEYVGIIDSIGFALKDIAGGSPFGTTQILLWISAFLSSAIDNIPITSALIPLMPILTFGFNQSQTQISYFALGLGANLGDNLTPMGDNILVMNLADQNKIKLSFKEFFQLGFFTTIIQLACASLYLGIRTIFI
ncbi:MAG: SLC13 family permease [Candidatus Helarchaeota archaeon]